jgi:Tfp pilus assembly protein PilF
MRFFSSQLLAIIVLSVGLWAGAQEPQPQPGVIRGLVIDEQGQPLTGAVIHLRHRGSSSEYEVSTSPDGRFRQRNLSLGRYDLTVMQDGKTLWKFPLRLTLAQASVQVELDIGKLREAARSFERFTADLRKRNTVESERRRKASALRAQHNRGVRHLREGKPEEAIAAFDGVLEAEPGRTSTQAMLASAFASTGRVDEAISIYEGLLQTEPNEASHHNNLAILLAELNRIEEAVARFERARSLDKFRTGTYEFNLGAVYLQSGQFRQSSGHFRKALRHDPTRADAQYFYGLSLIREGAKGKNQRNAVKAMRRYLQLEPEGAYAESARNHLQELGAPVTDMLLPNVRNREDEEFE